MDAMYRCYTEDKYGASIWDAPEEAKPYEKNFYDCLFRPSSGVDMCMNHFSDMIWSIYRDPDNELNDNY